MKVFDKTVVVIAACLLVSAALSVHAKPAAKVVFKFGDAQVVSVDGKARKVRRGDEIDSGETLVTGSGRMQARFTDGGFVSLQPNSRLELADYGYEADAPEKDSTVFNLLKGGFRAVTGLVGRRNRSSYRVDTPVATIGIRGTAYFALYCNADCFNRDGSLKPDGLRTYTGAGTTTVTNDRGTAVVSTGSSSFTKSKKSQTSVGSDADSLAALGSDGGGSEEGEESEDDGNDSGGAESDSNQESQEGLATETGGGVTPPEFVVGDILGAQQTDDFVSRVLGGGSGLSGRTDLIGGYGFSDLEGLFGPAFLPFAFFGVGGFFDVDGEIASGSFFNGQVGPGLRSIRGLDPFVFTNADPEDFANQFRAALIGLDVGTAQVVDSYSDNTVFLARWAGGVARGFIDGAASSIPLPLPGNASALVSGGIPPVIPQVATATYRFIPTSSVGSIDGTGNAVGPGLLDGFLRVNFANQRLEINADVGHRGNTYRITGFGGVFTESAGVFAGLTDIPLSNRVSFFSNQVFARGGSRNCVIACSVIFQGQFFGSAGSVGVPSHALVALSIAEQSPITTAGAFRYAPNASFPSGQSLNQLVVLFNESNFVLNSFAREYVPNVRVNGFFGFSELLSVDNLGRVTGYNQRTDSLTQVNFARGSAAHLEAGSALNGNIRWGRWSGGYTLVSEFEPGAVAVNSGDPPGVGYMAAIPFTGSANELRQIAGSSATYNLVGGPKPVDDLSGNLGQLTAAQLTLNLVTNRVFGNVAVRFPDPSVGNMDLSVNLAGDVFSGFAGGSGVRFNAFDTSGSCSGFSCFENPLGSVDGVVVDPQGRGIVTNYNVYGNGIDARGIAALRR